MDLSCAIGPETSIPTAIEQLRLRVRALVDDEAGLHVRRVDLTVEDVL